MRLIHIVPAITEEASGPSYSVVRLCESLIAQGQNVTLSALDWGSMTSTLPFLKTFPLGLGPRKLGRSPLMQRWLKEQVLNGSVDILHNHGMWQMNAVYPGWVARKGQINLVISPRGAFSKWAMQHGSFIKNIFWPLLQKPAIKAASCFHATSEAEYKDIRRLGFCQPVAVIPNGIDIPEYSPKHAGDYRTLLFLGRLHSVKGLDLLLPAWGVLQDRFTDWQLVIVGDDNGYYGKTGYLGDLQAMVKQLGLKRIKFIGELRGAEKLQAYRDADLFVLPSYSENFGMTVAESLAAGTPAIVSKGAPWSGLEKHGAGWWIDIGVDALVARLEEAMSTPPDRLTEMGIAGRGWMSNEFSWSRIGAMMSGTYQWLLNRALPVPAWVRLD